MSDRPLQNQVALVTGGAKRIGRAIALALAGAGASVVVNYNHSRAEAFATARDIRALGADSVAIRADVSKPKQVGAMFRAVEKRFGRLDILVNNAGVFFPAPLAQLNEADWDRILGINLKGTFFCAQAAAPVMLRQKRGCIINISSLGGLRAWPEYMHYCASKAGVIMLTKCLAKALAPHVRVNSVAPGDIMFPDGRVATKRKPVLRANLLGRPGAGSDIAAAVLFLATHSEFVTGQVIAVDGGKSIA
ncbi:MAG TPA: SDR family oxidoreductase [Terriglobia bacterium]|nr:SDR family oxidoreductase [Terriglobia bacterium]